MKKTGKKIRVFFKDRDKLVINTKLFKDGLMKFYIFNVTSIQLFPEAAARTLRANLPE